MPTYIPLSAQKGAAKSTYVPLRDRPDVERNPLLEAVKKAQEEAKEQLRIAEQAKVAEQKKNIFQKAGKAVSSFFGQTTEKKPAYVEKIGKEAFPFVSQETKDFVTKYFPESFLETVGINPKNIDQILKIEPRVGNLGLGVPPKKDIAQQYLNYDQEALKRVKIQQWVDNDVYADPTITWKDVNEAVPITVGQIWSKIPYVAIEGMNRFLEGAGASPVRIAKSLLDIVDPGGKIYNKYLPEKIDPLVVSILKLTGHEDWIQYLPEEQKRQLRLGRSAGVENEACLDAGGDLFVCFAMSFGSILMDVAIVADVVTSGTKFVRDYKGLNDPKTILKGGDIFKMEAYKPTLTEVQFQKYKVDMGLPDDYTIKNLETDLINAKDFGTPNAKPNTLGEVYKKQAHMYHPDNPLTGDSAKMVKINAAYEGLTGYKPEGFTIRKLADELTKERPLWDKAVDNVISGQPPEVQKRLQAPAPPEEKIITPEMTRSDIEIKLKEKGFNSLKEQIAMDAEKRGFPDIAKDMRAVDISDATNVQEVYGKVMEKSGELSKDLDFKDLASNRMATQQMVVQDYLGTTSDLVTTYFQDDGALQIKTKYPELAEKIKALNLKGMTLSEAYTEVKSIIPPELRDNDFINSTLDNFYKKTLMSIEGLITPESIVVKGGIVPKSTFTYRDHNWVIVDVLDDGTVKAAPFDPIVSPLNEISVKELQNRTAEELKEVFNVVKQEGKKVLQKSAEPMMNIPTENIVETYPIKGVPPAVQPTGITPNVPVAPEVVIPTIYKTLLPEQKLIYQKVYDAGIAKGLKPLEAGQKAIDVAVKKPEKPLVIPVPGKIVPEVPVVIAKTTQLTTESQTQVADLEKQLQDAYSKDAQAFTQAIESIKQEVSGTGIEKAIWIPEDLRSKDLVDKAIQGLTSQGISFPGEEAKQTELLNNIFNRIDSQLGLNTTPIREKIVKIYEGAPKAVTTKGIAGGVQKGTEVGQKIFNSTARELAITPEGRLSKIDFIETGINYYKTTDEYLNVQEGNKRWAINTTQNELGQLYEETQRIISEAKPKPKGQPLVQPKAKNVLTKQEIKEGKELGIDLTKVPKQYITEARQQLEFLREEKAKLSRKDYSELVKKEYAEIEARRKEGITFREHKEVFPLKAKTVTQKEAVAKAIEEKPVPKEEVKPEVKPPEKIEQLETELEKTYQENKVKEEAMREVPPMGFSVRMTTEGSINKPVTPEHALQLRIHFNNFKKRIDEILSPLSFHKNAPPELRNAIRTDVIGGLDKVYESRNRNQIILWGGVPEKDIASSIEIIRLRDQLARIKADKGNPEITLEEAQKALDIAEKNATPAALEAAERYRMLVKKYTQDLVDRGKLDPDELMEDYMRHYVADYTPDWVFNKGIPTRLRQPFRGYLKRAGKTTKEYRVDQDTILGQFLEVEHDNMIEDFIVNQSEKYDIKPTLSEESLKEILGINKATGKIRPVKPSRFYIVGGKKYRGFNPSTPFNRVIFPTDEGLMALGRYKKTYLIPEEVYNAFRDFSERGSAMVYYTNRVVSYWKTTAILSHFPSYNINNLVGDTWMVLAQSPNPIRVLKEVPTAITYLTTKKPSAYLKQLDKFIKDNDIVDATYIEGELPRIRKASNPLLYLIQKSQKVSQFRESIMRIADASYLFKEMQKGNGAKLVEFYDYMNLKGLSGSEALGKVARDILVDYKWTSKTFNRAIRGFVFPFGTWYFKGSAMIWRFARRHWGKALLAFLAPPIIAALWNDRNEETKEMEASLPDYIQNRVHFILGKNPDGTVRVWSLQLPQDALIGTKIFSIAVNQANLVAIGVKNIKEAALYTLKEWGIKEAKGIVYLTNFMVRFVQGLINQKDPYDNSPIYSMPPEKMTGQRKTYEQFLYFLKTTIPVISTYIKDYTIGNPIDLTKKDFVDRMAGLGALGINDIGLRDKIYFEGKKIEWEDIEKLKEIYGRELEILDRMETKWIESGTNPNEFMKTEEFKESLEEMRDMYSDYLPEYKEISIQDIVSGLGERLTNRLGNSTDSARKWYKVQLERATTDEEKRTLSEKYRKLREQNMLDAIKAYSKSSREIFKDYLRNKEE